MLQYINIKKQYIKLKKLYGGGNYSYQMDPRGINYYITINITSVENVGNWKLKIGNPAILNSSCNDIKNELKNCNILQNFINSITIKKYNGKQKYVSELLYDQYKGIVEPPQQYNFTLERKIKTSDTKKYANNSWVYIDYVLIQRYIEDIYILSQRITIDSEEIKNNLYIDINKKWALLPHNTSLINNNTLCDEHKYNFKYFIPIFDENIKTIFHFTREHITLLIDIKKVVINWIITNKWNNCEYDNIEELKTKIRIYTLFPNQSYLYPFFLVDYQDDLGINYTRIVDKTRMITIDYIIENLNSFGDMKKYYCKYYTSRDSKLFILAQEMVKESLNYFFKIFENQLFPQKASLSELNRRQKKTKKTNTNSFDVFTEDETEDETEDKKEDETEDEKEENSINALISQHFVLNIPLDVKIFNTKRDLIDEARQILKDKVKYKYLHYFQKYLLKNNKSMYSFVTQWKILLQQQTKQKPEQKPEQKPKQKLLQQLEQKPEEKHVFPKLTEYTVLMQYFDGTRGTSPFNTYIGVYCQKLDEFFQINIISDKLFKDNKNATRDDFPLIENIKNKLEGREIKEVTLQQGIDGYYSGKGTNNGEIPCYVEIHKLPGKLDDILNKRISDIKIKYDDYSDYLYTYNLIKGDMKLEKETKTKISNDLTVMTNRKLDDDFPLLFALILYRYTDNTILKDIIREKLLDNLPEKYIYFNQESPFIVIPDISFLKSYKKRENKADFKMRLDNYDMIVWHADKYIYDNALKVIYKKPDSVENIIYKKPDSVENIIKNLKRDDLYPFDKGLIDKFLVNKDKTPIIGRNEFPHIFRYTSINLLDKLYIFLNDFNYYVIEELKISVIDNVIERYFHNTDVNNSILHLHLRAKDKIHKLRHLYGGIYNDNEYLIVYDLDDVYRNLLYDEQYYRNKIMYVPYKEPPIVKSEIL